MTTASVAGISANTEAKVRHLPTGWPTFLAIVPQVVGLALGLLWYSLGGPPLGGLAVGVAGGFGTLLLAMMQAGHDSNAAAGKALKYTVLYCIAFPIELIGGGILLLLYVLPYVLVAGLISMALITAQSKSRRERLASWRDPNAYPWQQPPHDYGPPTGVPPLPDYGLALGANFEPPSSPDYGLPVSGLPPSPDLEPPAGASSPGPVFEPPTGGTPAGPNDESAPSADHGVTPGPNYEPPPAPDAGRPPGPVFEPPTSGPQTGPFFDPRQPDDPDTPTF